MQSRSLLLVGTLLMATSGLLAIVAWHDGAIGVAARPADLPPPGDEGRIRGQVAEADRAAALRDLVRWNAIAGSPLAKALAAGPHDLVIAQTDDGPLLCFLEQGAAEGLAGRPLVVSGEIAAAETVVIAGAGTVHAVLLSDAELTQPIVF